ncbi:MAG: hypothetical protein JSW27_08945 [Phycisphaerales bacterium]|nr:MAG: hypothetical protein JSW27_08945 [Phycisphaerales bacterium]
MKAPDVNIKDVLKKLSFLKNNLALLVPIVIVIVSLLLFIPTRILGSRLRDTVEKQSVQLGTRVDSLMRDVGSVAQAEALEEYINAYEADVNEIESLVAQTVQRELLSYNIFPDTNETSLALYEDFGRAYRQGIEAMLDRMEAGVCPTDEEIEGALKSAPRQMAQPGMAGYGGDPAYSGMGAYGGMGPYGGGGAGRRSYRMMGPLQRKIADQICLDRASRGRVYAGPADIAGYAYWDEWKFEDKDKAYKDCWYWQLGYWIIEDVTESIRAINENATSVLDAPVKRLESVDFMMKRNRSRRGRGGRRVRRRDTDSDNPVYVTDTRDAMTTPCTGRFTSDEKGIDVVQFDVRVIVNVDQVMSFMEELCSAKQHKFRGFYGDQPERTFMHNQISILESSVGPVDKQSRTHDLYRYGDLPVVELDLLCEYVFQRTIGFEGIKPQQVKDELAGEEEED